MIENPLFGKDVLITGGTGAFGAAFCVRAIMSGARRIILFSRSEAKQAMMRAELQHPRLRFMIGDVRDESRVRDACRDVDVVVHAAALKRIEVCEGDPREAIATNIMGTLNVARACVDAGVGRAVFLSTDKASNPSTLYGATKLAAERAWIQYNVYSAGTQSRFAATRYGNVLGSTGSVVPIWREQRKTGPIQVTDLTMTRFWMTMGQAVDLVQLAIANMIGGEVFVPKITSSALSVLADAIAPGVDRYKITARAGEKSHESLISADEARYTYDAGSHYIIEPSLPLWQERPAPMFEPVPEGFSYRSDTNVPHAGVEDLQRMLAVS